MRPFAYERAGSAEEALKAARQAGDEVKYLGGGTNLVDLMRLSVERPQRLIDVSRLDGIGVSRLEDGRVRVGGAVRNSDLAVDELIRREYPLLSEALLMGASPQLRNRATVAGNLLQRTRCSYFQDVSKPCNKREPGSGCAAMEGENHNHAILGWSESCVATHPSDMAVALAALEAEVEVIGPNGGRSVPLPGFHRLPGDEAQRDTVLEPQELITGLVLSAPMKDARSRYRKVRERASYAFALVSVAAIARVADGVVQECRVALGGVAHAPWRAERAEAILNGGAATAEQFELAAESELAAAKPLRENGYKVALAKNVLVQTLTEVCL